MHRSLPFPHLIVLVFAEHSFFDLFYVAAAYNLAILLMESLADGSLAEGLLYFSCCFFSIVVLWLEKLGWDCRYVSDDNLFTRAVEVIQLVFLGIAIQHIRPVEFMKDTCGHSTTFVYLLSMSILFVIQIAMKVDLSINIDGGPEAVTATKWDMQLKTCGGICIWIATALAARDYFFTTGNEQVCGEHGNPVPIVLSGLIIVFEQTYYHLVTIRYQQRSGRNHEEFTVPFNAELCIHRYVLYFDVRDNFSTPCLH